MRSKGIQAITPERMTCSKIKTEVKDLVQSGMEILGIVDDEIVTWNGDYVLKIKVNRMARPWNDPFDRRYSEHVNFANRDQGLEYVNQKKAKVLADLEAFEKYIAEMKKSLTGE